MFQLSKTQLSQYLTLTLITSLLVIFWGAFLRFTYAGDGCGTDWPLCHNQLVPTQSSKEAWMEWFHRLTSSLFGLMVVFLCIFSFHSLPKKHRARWGCVLILFFTITEALIGAALVMTGLTGLNSSLLRPLVLSAHLVNSLFLVGSIVLTFRFIREDVIPIRKIFRWSLFYILIALTGSIASLSNTLFPSSSLIQGLLMDINMNSPLLLKLRILHPVIAFVIGGGLIIYLTDFFKKFRIKNYLLLIFTALGMMSGILTLFTLSPIFMKMLHLILAYSVWIFILLI